MEEIEKRAGALWAGLGVKSEVTKILQREYGLSLRQAERALRAFIQAGGGGVKGERVYIIADGLPIYSGWDYDEVVRLRDRHWPDALISDHAPFCGVRILTKQHDRDFLVGQGFGFRTVRWSAWREPRPMVRGYGMTEQGAIKDLVENVQPLVEVEG